MPAAPGCLPWWPIAALPLLAVTVVLSAETEQPQRRRRPYHPCHVLVRPRPVRDLSVLVHHRHWPRERTRVDRLQRTSIPPRSPSSPRRDRPIVKQHVDPVDSKRFAGAVVLVGHRGVPIDSNLRTKSRGMFGSVIRRPNHMPEVVIPGCGVASKGRSSNLNHLALERWAGAKLSSVQTVRHGLAVWMIDVEMWRR